jgi:hypothetical protein
MNIMQEVALEAAYMSEGESRRVVCPQCRGGDGAERSFSISRTGGLIKFNCHRASCPAKGVMGGRASYTAEARVERTPDNYTGSLQPLWPTDIRAFRDVYETNVKDNDLIHVNDTDEYVLPIYGPDEYIRGYNVRQPWKGTPRKGRRNQPKSNVYMHSMKPVQSFYEGMAGTGTVVIVEDQLSAMKAAQHSRIGWGVAIMGSHLDVARVAEIQKLRPSQVLIALDCDATQKAFELAREYGLAFPKTRVVILDRDIKDTPAKDINEVLGV